MAVHGDHTRPTVTEERKPEKALGSHTIPVRRQQESIVCAVESTARYKLCPFSGNPDKRFINPPQSPGWAHPAPDAVVQDRSVVQNPAGDGRVIQR
jgi:hypothetical protein